MAHGKRRNPVARSLVRKGGPHRDKRYERRQAVRQRLRKQV